LTDLKARIGSAELLAADEVRAVRSALWTRIDDVQELVPALIECQQQLIDELLDNRRKSLPRRAPQTPAIAKPRVAIGRKNRPALQRDFRLPKDEFELLELAPVIVPVEQAESRSDRLQARPAATAPLSAVEPLEVVPTKVTERQRPVRRMPVKSSPRRFRSPVKEDRRIQTRVALMGAAVALLIGLAAASRLDRTTDAEYFATIDAVWNELHAIQQSDRSDIERRDFARRASEKLRAIVDELEQTAGGHAPARQNMLWAARDYLLPILKPMVGAGTRTSPSRQAGNSVSAQVEEHFLEQMQLAQQLLETNAAR
jgi:hypothetical protein